MSQTLNQIVKKITDYASSHAQINVVKFGEMYDFLSEGDITYPALLFNVATSRILAKQTRFSFVLYFIDRQLQETDGLEIMSDMTLVAQDIVAKLRDNSNPWIVSDDIVLEFFAESEPDFLAGVSIDIALTISNINNRCEVPIV